MGKQSEKRWVTSLAKKNISEASFSDFIRANEKKNPDD